MIKCLVFCTALFTVTGCYDLAFVASPGARVTTLSRPGGRTFRVSRGYGFVLWGLVPNTKIVEVNRLVSEELGFRVRDISDLEIETDLAVGSFFLGSLLTLGLATSQRVVVQGRIHDPIPKVHDRQEVLIQRRVPLRSEQRRKRKIEKEKKLQKWKIEKEKKLRRAKER